MIDYKMQPVEVLTKENFGGDFQDAPERFFELGC